MKLCEWIKIYEVSQTVPSKTLIGNRLVDFNGVAYLLDSEFLLRDIVGVQAGAKQHFLHLSENLSKQEAWACNRHIAPALP